MLRTSKPIDEVFDTWLEVAAALRKVNQQITQALDTHIRDRVAEEFALARWAVIAIASSPWPRCSSSPLWHGA